MVISLASGSNHQSDKHAKEASLRASFACYGQNMKQNNPEHKHFNPKNNSSKMIPVNSIQSKRNELQAFTLTELIFAVAIVGALSAMAIPNFYSQLLTTRQRGCASTLSMVQTSTMLFNDEFSSPPRHWADLHSMTPLLTTTGTAAEIENLIPSCDENYNYWGLLSSDLHLHLSTYQHKKDTQWAAPLILAHQTWPSAKDEPHIC